MSERGLPEAQGCPITGTRRRKPRGDLAGAVGAPGPHFCRVTTEREPRTRVTAPCARSEGRRVFPSSPAFCRCPSASGDGPPPRFTVPCAGIAVPAPGTVLIGQMSSVPRPKTTRPRAGTHVAARGSPLHAPGRSSVYKSRSPVRTNVCPSAWARRPAPRGCRARAMFTVPSAGTTVRRHFSVTRAPGRRSVRNQDRHRRNGLETRALGRASSAAGSRLREVSAPHERPPACGGRGARSSRALARPLQRLGASDASSDAPAPPAARPPKRSGAPAP
jgi:hypothetical protein